ncbi:hypothetical protein SPHINGO8BC_51225 [Sphingobacterium multivorum]|uniref:Uncharacterized protein n=1 Tax=Sphingobacterium multivorum TaxID=28454 RepID=A0A654CW62_SPHMU|nr:hypothetical protein SPHINGO8BC_51225 [Sphingobacterium multivorum]
MHYSKNVSDAVAKLLRTVVPAGLEDFFRDWAASSRTRISASNECGSD